MVLSIIFGTVEFWGNFTEVSDISLAKINEKRKKKKQLNKP